MRNISICIISSVKESFIINAINISNMIYTLFPVLLQPSPDIIEKIMKLSVFIILAYSFINTSTY